MANFLYAAGVHGEGKTLLCHLLETQKQNHDSRTSEGDLCDDFA